MCPNVIFKSERVKRLPSSKTYTTKTIYNSHVLHRAYRISKNYKKGRKRRLKKGILLAIEGLDGSGKTTQAKLLYTLLSQEGYNVCYLKEPTDGKWGKKIKKISQSKKRVISREGIQKEFELFLKDRKFDVENNIKPNINKHAIVILDRYYYSSIAYQGSLGYIAAEEIKKENEKIAPRPNIVFILDIPPVISTTRIHTDGENGVRNGFSSFESEKNLERVREAFLHLRDPIVHMIDGTRTRGAILDAIFNVVISIAQSLEVH